MTNLWNNVKREYVIKAIQEFEKLNQDYPEPKNTFLVHNGNKYPAKHIRGIAFKIANKREIKKSEYSGGQETVNFFRKLGFEVEYRKNRIKEVAQPTIQKPLAKRLSVVEQKNALQKILQRFFGIIETEKKFEWLVTPNPVQLPSEYKKIVEGLIKYRNQKTFLKAIYSLACDVVIEQHKIIVEYDENQHFSQARKTTLENYPDNVKTYFSKSYWIEQCNKINAKDNHPVDRDEKRAYYDSVRDIETFKHNYKLIRIKHGDFDWKSESAIDYLKKIIPEELENHKIARIVISGKQYKDGEPILVELKSVLVSFIQEAYPNIKFEFIVTPGGFLTFKWPSERIDKDVANSEKNLQSFCNIAELKINEFFNHLGKEIFDKLKETADYFTIGIDSKNPNNKQHIELIAVYDLKKSKIINWTGKFYPTERQKRYLIKINDLDTHFTQLNNQKIVFLGCHDLNVFNPRGQANANPDSWKRKKADNFKKLCQEFKPDIILHHPHTTDTPNIWNLAWKTVESKLPCVKHYASGIKYYNSDGHLRGALNKVLEKTKKGDVIDFIYV